jgi:hypothetical protein
MGAKLSLDTLVYEATRYEELDQLLIGMIFLEKSVEVFSLGPPIRVNQ